MVIYAFTPEPCAQVRIEQCSGLKVRSGLTELDPRVGQRDSDLSPYLYNQQHIETFALLDRVLALKLTRGRCWAGGTWPATCSSTPPPGISTSTGPRPPAKTWACCTCMPATIRAIPGWPSPSTTGTSAGGWADHDVYQPKYGSKRSHHPLVGDLTLGFEAFKPMGDPDQTLGLYTVEPGSPSENALRLLASWTADTTHIQREEGLGVRLARPAVGRRGKPERRGWDRLVPVRPIMRLAEATSAGGPAAVRTHGPLLSALAA